MGPSVDPDLGRSCSYFSSLSEVEDLSPAARRTRTWMWIVIGILAAMVLLVLAALGPLRTPQPMADMRVDKFPMQWRVGEMQEGAITIRNLSATTFLPCLMKFGGGFFDGLEVVKMQPTADQSWPDIGGRVYSFLPIPTGTTRYLTLTCRARKVGSFPLDVMLLDKERNVLDYSSVVLQVSP